MAVLLAFIGSCAERKGTAEYLRSHPGEFPEFKSERRVLPYVGAARTNVERMYGSGSDPLSGDPRVTRMYRFAATEGRPEHLLVHYRGDIVERLEWVSE